MNKLMFEFKLFSLKFGCPLDEYFLDILTIETHSSIYSPLSIRYHNDLKEFSFQIMFLEIYNRGWFWTKLWEIYKETQNKIDYKNDPEKTIKMRRK